MNVRARNHVTGCRTAGQGRYRPPVNDRIERVIEQAGGFAAGALFAVIGVAAVAHLVGLLHY